MGGIHRHESSMEVFGVMGKIRKGTKIQKRNNPRNKALVHFVLFSHRHSISNFDPLGRATVIYSHN